MAKDYCVQIHTYHKDYAMLLGCLVSIRAHLDDAHIQVISDGAYMTDEMAERVKSFGNVNLVVRERMMPYKNHGCAWIVQKLKLLLETPFDLFFCFDTDARVWRKPFYIPDTSYFGNLVIGDSANTKRYSGPIPQGGCWGFTRQFASLIYEGGYFADNNIWQSLDLPFVQNAGGVIADDFYIPHVAVHYLRLYPFNWDEVLAVWNQVPQNPLVNGIPRYAITHSHYRH